MITFLFKPKPIHLDCFTTLPHVYEYAPIQHANRFLPDWWKNLPKTHPYRIATMKSCSGLIDLYREGLIIPMWSDLIVEVFTDGSYKYYYADGMSTAVSHAPLEAGVFFTEANVTHLKLKSPWLFSTKSDINWHFAQPIWNQNAAKDYCVPSGVINFKHTNSTEVNILFRKTNVNTIVDINHNTPLAHIIPLSEKPLKIKTHLIDEKEYSMMAGKNQRIMFHGGYLRKKQISQDKESKCPFNRRFI